MGIITCLKYCPSFSAMKASRVCPGALQMWCHEVSATVVNTESQGTAMLPWVFAVSVSMTRVNIPGWQPTEAQIVSPGNSVSTCISAKISAMS